MSNIIVKFIKKTVRYMYIVSAITYLLHVPGMCL